LNGIVNSNRMLVMRYVNDRGASALLAVVALDTTIGCDGVGGVAAASA
jgi:hypothetical protein